MTLVKLTREQIEKEFYEYTLECRRRLDQLFTPTTTTTTTTTDSNSSIRSNRAKSQPRNAIQVSSSSMKMPSSRNNNNNNNNRLINFSTISGNYKIFKVMPPTMTTTPNIAKARSCSQSRHSRPSNHHHHDHNNSSTLRPPPQPTLVATTTTPLIRDKSDQHQHHHHVDLNGEERTSRVGKSKSPTTTLKLKSFRKPLSLEKIWHI